MTTRDEGLLTDWYSRIVLGVIAVSLAMLAVQGACSVEPVVHAQRSRCGDATYNPCYVEVVRTVDVYVEGGTVSCE